MNDRDLYARILGVESPWMVKAVELDDAGVEVRVMVEHGDRQSLRCPCCGKPASGYDTRRRRWRHLDTCQYRTILVAEVPRVECVEHGVKQIEAPWAEEGSGFTAMFEWLVISWLREASILGVSRRMGLSWDETDGIMQRAAARGLARRRAEAPARLGVDEVSIARGHRYMTVMTDLDAMEVLHVAEDRTSGSLESYFHTLNEAERSKIEVVSMDMWQPYIAATKKHLPGAQTKIAFDKFHVAQHLGEAVDRVRRREQRSLSSEGDDRLKGTKYLWLRHPSSIDLDRWRGEFRGLRESTLKTARAWALKEAAMSLWEYASRGWARRAWRSWINWAARSRLEPMMRVARMIREHLAGIVNAIVHRATNAGAESINAKIRRVRRMACGFRNPQRFRTAIYFHCGHLDLAPASLTHTNS
jgi:transposase